MDQIKVYERLINCNKEFQISMKKRLSQYLMMIFCISVFTGCVSTKKLSLRNDLVRTENKLGINLTKWDNLEFYVECSNWLGTSYRHGGMSKNGVDCSGFTNVIYNNVFNKKLERSSHLIYSKNCRRISKSSLKPGDLVFFRTGKSRKIDHVGIYLKDNKFIHASPRGGVRVDSLNDKYYKMTYYKSGRVR